MAARLLLLVVVMVIFAALYGCAQEAAKDRQPMKRLKEPTMADSSISFRPNHEAIVECPMHSPYE